MPSLAGLKAAIPPRYKQAARRSFLRLASITNAGSRVTCPCCGRSFRKFARFHGAHEQCPGCGSLMRHRAIALYLRDVLELRSTGGDVLLVAPGALQPWLRAIESVRMISVDLDSPLADVQADVTDLPFADESFDLVVCLHVLEHVPDDRKAIAEFLRVLRPGGTAVLQVPPDPVEKTIEDLSVTSPAERQRLFDQYDHVRLCGPDYGLRMEEAGFEVTSEDHVEQLGEAERVNYGLRPGEPFYVCVKPRAARVTAPRPHAGRDEARIDVISVIAPMWNEAEHIEGLVADIAAQDFVGEVELLVADGGSTDGSVDILRAASERHGIDVRVFDNPARFVSHGLNLCIATARGDLIVRVDCHSRYPPDYLSRCATASIETGAANVGGVFIATGRTKMERAVACAMDSPFGGVHWSRHSAAAGRVEVDTVPYGAFRPDAFRRAGLFDESLVRNQDDEFNLRLRRAGGKIVLDPSIRIFYTPRGSLRGVFRQYFQYGRWKAPVMRRHGQATSARSLAPGAFVTSLVVLTALAPFARVAMVLLILEIGAYETGSLLAGVGAVRGRREQWRLLPRVLAVFPTFHLAHGAGMVSGWVHEATRGGKGGRPPDPPIRRVSVVAPMLNEADHLDELVEDLANQDYRGKVELLVADGGSTDGSVERLRDATGRRGLELTVLDNPDRWVSHGLNRCIRAAGGDLIVRVDCHSRYPPDYLRRCVNAAEETGADNVGGVVIPTGRSKGERAVACAMESPFGGIGWTRHAGGSRRAEVDTVTYGAFRPSMFERVGLFDESLVRNQDDELNLRLRLGGGQVVLDPAIRVHYKPRGSLSKVFRQYYQYGLWKVPVMLKHGRVLSARSLAGGCLVTSVALLAAIAPWWAPGAWILAAELALYAALALTFGAVAIRKRRERWRLLPRVVAVFPAFHVGHGAGMLHGWLRAVLRRARRRSPAAAVA
jgi:succinoglycan biosynthesis protein ExoA